MENNINYTKATLLLVSGMLAVAASLFLGQESEGYGFLVGYGYTAVAGGLAGMLYSYLKTQRLRKQGKAS
ncbi:hypothetical protein [Pontibacter litorisediminis]|uniref:hypothetical protein n=1 Tax=Pontibacter litorisediminis TaxID=1846260 RepID=UPI0023EC8492|nr:hypothetical protein [Pontibacter litorisediminis]